MLYFVLQPFEAAAVKRVDPDGEEAGECQLTATEPAGQAGHTVRQVEMVNHVGLEP